VIANGYLRLDPQEWSEPSRSVGWRSVGRALARRAARALCEPNGRAHPRGFSGEE
jgi:hypothetical protein